MTWDAERSQLRCDQQWHAKGMARSCPETVKAGQHGEALRLAADKGWARLPRGGAWRDKCPQHKPERTKTR